MTTAAKPAVDHGYNADEKATERESADVVIGGQTFRRRRKNWNVTRQMRELLNAQQRAGDRQQALQRKFDELDGTAAERLRLDAAGAAETDRQRMIAKAERLDDLRAQLNAEADKADEAAFGLISLLLVEPRSEGDVEVTNPPIAFLKESLDVVDAGKLAAKLTSGGEPDPTQPTATS
jgi:cell division protein FtsX